MLRISEDWKDYECLDAGNGEKLERWGDIILRRPEPQAMWSKDLGDEWNRVDGFYHRSSKGGVTGILRVNFPIIGRFSIKNLLLKLHRQDLNILVYFQNKRLTGIL